MARYQPPGTRGPQSGGMLPARRQLPPPEPPVRQRAQTAMVLGVLSLIALMLGLGNLRRGVFVAVLALLFAAGAIWLGVTASKKARRSGTARPRWAVGGVLLGSLGVAFSAMWLLVLAVFWPQLNAYYNCLGGANTVTAQQACHQQLTNSVGGEISVLQNGRLRLVGVFLDHADLDHVVLVLAVLPGNRPRVQVDAVPVGVVSLVVLAVGKEWRGG
jgi:hypothetical protein